VVAQRGTPLCGTTYNPVVQRSQQALLRRCHRFVEDALEGKEHSREQLQEFLHGSMPHVLENVERSVQIRVDRYHRQTEAAIWIGSSVG
jgi:hypothetical protein